MYASMCLVNGIWGRLPVSALMLRQLAKGRLRFLLPGTTTPTSPVFYQPPSFSYYRFGTSVHFFRSSSPGPSNLGLSSHTSRVPDVIHSSWPAIPPEEGCWNTGSVLSVHGQLSQVWSQSRQSRPYDPFTAGSITTRLGRPRPTELYPMPVATATSTIGLLGWPHVATFATGALAGIQTLTPPSLARRSQ
jgi:hypothetical protein